MSGNENHISTEPLSGTTSGMLNKSIGKVIININSDILELQSEYRKVKPGITLSSKGIVLEKSVREKRDALEESVKDLEHKPDFVSHGKMEKTIQMMKINIATASKVLDGGSDGDEIPESELTEAQSEAEKTVHEIDEIQRQVEAEMRNMALNLSTLGPAHNISEERIDELTEEEKIALVLNSLDQYQAARFHKMKNEIEVKINFNIDDLKTKWKEQKDILDHQALKEIRSEFEATHKKMRFMVNEWDKRKLSDMLSDHLMDKVDHKFDEYIDDFRRMDEEKRKEAAVLRKKNAEMEEYKQEKRRAIPSWPKSLPYSKFKPDLLSWDKEHHLSSGSAKFGLLAEMLKTHERITTYEQIQTRLGKSRNDSNIIVQKVSLLDTINEETVYNKLCDNWGAITGLKKSKEESLNDFFSRFETLQYSLNLADDTYAGVDIIPNDPIRIGEFY